MNITNQTPVEAQQQQQQAKDARRSSDRFASLLDKQRRQQHDADKAVEIAEKSERNKKLQGDSKVLDGSSHGVSSDTTAAPATLLVDAGRTPPAAAAMPADLHKLAEELGHQLELVQARGKTQGIDISLHSKTLPGLLVQIRQAKGQLAIRFISASSSTKHLLAQHTVQLQRSLEERGLKIAGISFAGSRYPARSYGSTDATL